MKEQLTVLTRKGQITVPAEIRRALGLQQGNKVAISLDDQGARLRPVRSVTEMTFGSLQPRSRAEEYPDARATAVEEIAENAATEGLRSVPDRQ